MEQFLRKEKLPASTLEKALEIALDAWTIGHLALTAEPSEDLPPDEDVAKHRAEQLTGASIEAAILTDTGTAATWRALRDAEVRSQLEKR